MGRGLSHKGCGPLRSKEKRETYSLLSLSDWVKLEVDGAILSFGGCGQPRDCSW